jgi:hypothetical protein
MRISGYFHPPLNPLPSREGECKAKNWQDIISSIMEKI